MAVECLKIRFKSKREARINILIDREGDPLLAL